MLRRDELIVAVQLPPSDLAAHSTYRKVRERASFSFAVVSVAAALDVRDGRVEDVRIALGGVAHKPWRARVAEDELRGAPADAATFDRRSPAGAGAGAAAPRQRLQGRPGARDARPHADGAGGVSVATRSIGTPVDRIEGREKVSGAARYAFEHNQENVAYAVIVQSEIAHGMIRHVDAGEALALDGVVAVLHHGNAPRLPASGELAVLQSADVAYRGQIVAAVVADELETAQQAAGLVRVGYHALEHDVILRADHPGLYAPERVNPNFATDTAEGDVEAALAGAASRGRPHVHDAGGAQQCDGAARHGGDLGRCRG